MRLKLPQRAIHRVACAAGRQQLLQGHAIDVLFDVAAPRFDPRVVVEMRNWHAADYRSVRRSLSVS